MYGAAFLSDVQCSRTSTIGTYLNTLLVPLRRRRNFRLPQQLKQMTCLLATSDHMGRAPKSRKPIERVANPGKVLKKPSS